MMNVGFEVLYGIAGALWLYLGAPQKADR